MCNMIRKLELPRIVCIWMLWNIMTTLGSRMKVKHAKAFNMVPDWLYVHTKMLSSLNSLKEPVCCSMSSSNCCFLTCIQISQEEAQMVWYSHLFKNFPQFVMIHTVKSFGVVNKAKVDVFLEFPCFLYHPTNVGHLISGSSAFSKPSLYLWKFSVHVLLKPSLKDFAGMWNACNCKVIWTCFGIAFLWDWNENWLFPVLWPRLSFPNLLAYWA